VQPAEYATDAREPVRGGIAEVGAPAERVGGDPPCLHDVMNPERYHRGLSGWTGLTLASSLAVCSAAVYPSGAVIATPDVSARPEQQHRRHAASPTLRPVSGIEPFEPALPQEGALMHYRVPTGSFGAPFPRNPPSRCARIFPRPPRPPRRDAVECCSCPEPCQWCPAALSADRWSIGAPHPAPRKTRDRDRSQPQV